MWVILNRVPPTTKVAGAHAKYFMENEVKHSFAEKFKTRTKFIDRKNPAGNKFYIGMDIGYSACKVFGEDNIFVFPSYARRQTLQMDSFGKLDDNYIQYKDLETGEIWIIGDTNVDKDDTEDFLYARRRYLTDMYIVLARACIGFAAKGNYTKEGKEKKKLYIQTGLPPEYREEDTKVLKKAICTRHRFALKKGSADWVEFDIKINDDQVGVIDQPFAGLVCASCTQNAKAKKGSESYFRDHTLLLDIGFGTADIYDIFQNNFASKPLTWEEFGMKAVFRSVTEEIHKRTGKTVSIPDLQQYLKEGVYRGYDYAEEAPVSLDFNSILQEKSEKLCNQLLDRLNKTKDLSIYQTVVLDGGTAYAWIKVIKEFIKQKGFTANVISAAENDTISAIYSNARGYYMYALTQNK